MFSKLRLMSHRFLISWELLLWPCDLSKSRIYPTNNVSLYLAYGTGTQPAKLHLKCTFQFSQIFEGLHLGSLLPAAWSPRLTSVGSLSWVPECACCQFVLLCSKSHGALALSGGTSRSPSLQSKAVPLCLMASPYTAVVSLLNSCYILPGLVWFLKDFRSSYHTRGGNKCNSCHNVMVLSVLPKPSCSLLPCEFSALNCLGTFILLKQEGDMSMAW